MCIPLVLYSATYSATKSIRGQVRCVVIMKENIQFTKTFLTCYEQGKEKMYFVADFSFCWLYLSV